MAHDAMTSAAGMPALAFQAPTVLSDQEIALVGGGKGKGDEILAGAALGFMAGAGFGPVGGLVGGAVGGFLGWLFG